MIYGADLFFSLFNNLAIFIALVTVYGYLITQFKQSVWFRRQALLGLSFGVFAIGCMYAKIPVFEGVIVDQRNAIIALSGAFGGPLSAIISATLAGAYRAYLGGGGVLAGVIGVGLSAMAGIILNKFPGCFSSMQKAATSAIAASIMILPGFLFVKDLQTGWELMKAMALPYGLAISCGIFLVGLLLNKEEERYYFELSFKNSEEKYRELIEGTEDLITQIDKNGHFTFINRVAEKILGITPKELLGMSAFQFIHPDDRDRTIKRFEECVAQKRKQMKIENRQVNSKTGESRTILWSSSFQYDESGSLVGAGGIGRDITDSLKSMEALQRSERRLNTILEASPDPVIVYDTEGTPQYLNPSFTTVFGWTFEELKGIKIPFVPEDEKKISALKIREIYRSGRPVTFLSKRLTKHGKILDVIISAAIIKAPDNRPIGMVVNLTDITEQKKLENQLQQAQKMESVGRLAGGVAHDFNNMLSIILGNAEMILDDIDKKSPIAENIRQIHKAAIRSANFTRQLLAFARKQTISPKVIDLNKTLEGMLNMLRRLIGEDIDFSWNPKIGLWMVEIDPSQVDQLLANLCVNARDSIKGVGKITIETDNVHFSREYCHENNAYNPGDYAMIAVSDNGCGMDKEILANIFEPFFTTKKTGRGTGLGLATVDGIVKQNNGFINVYSEPKKGTTFKIYLPRHIETTTQVQKYELNEVLAHGNETILLVEDEKSILDMTASMLGRLGYTVISASNPVEALDISKSCSKKIHLLITDVVMPVMNGRDLSEKLRGHFPGLKCLYMSGYTANVIAHQGVLDEGTHFIEKPFSKQELSIKVRSVLDDLS